MAQDNIYYSISHNSTTNTAKLSAFPDPPEAKQKHSEDRDYSPEILFLQPQKPESKLDVTNQIFSTLERRINIQKLTLILSIHHIRHFSNIDEKNVFVKKTAVSRHLKDRNTCILSQGPVERLTRRVYKHPSLSHRIPVMFSVS